MVELRATIDAFLCYNNWVMGFIFAGSIFTTVNGLLSVFSVMQLIGFFVDVYRVKWGSRKIEQEQKIF